MEIIKKISDNTKKLNKIDWIIMGIMVLIYGIISFWNLGDTKAPQTYYTFNNVGDTVEIALKEETLVNTIRYYTGNNLGQIDVSYSIDGVNYTDLITLDIGGVFSWQETLLNNKAKYVRFVGKSEGATLGEVGFFFAGKRLPVIADMDNPLIDEIDLIPDEISYMNSTYFDEIYYARTVYEYIHGINVFEWSHPPLGKLIMSIPVLLFGFSPFAYRFMGNIFGILLIPLMYILAKRIFKNRKWALLAGLLMMFDTFHFAHTRIALVEGFQLSFILLSVLFMKQYLDLDKDASFKKEALYLLLSGTFIGCAIATKWNALYAGLGLAIVFFVHLAKQYNFNLIKFLKKSININKIIKFLTIFVFTPFALYYFLLIVFSKSAADYLTFIYLFVAVLFLLTMFYSSLAKDKHLLKLFFICVLSFILIPVIIYVLSYILFPTVSNYDGTLKGIIDVNKMMYEYHSGLDATHPFSSSWYQWPFMTKPVWLYTGGAANGLSRTIVDIGNPFIWWVGIIAFIYVLINAFIKKNNKMRESSIFIVIFVLSTYLPYIFIGRLMFLYHYFITLPFIMLAIVSFIKWITENMGNDKVYYGYIALILITFIVFYPVVSGMPISNEYVESLRWFSGWYF